MKLSVIIPVYRVEDTLDRCVESVLGQQVEAMEVMLVDDGSPDRCPQMCDEWAERDQRIRVIHKPNGGLSDARNAGLDVAAGDYVTFVDSDDWVEPSTYPALLRTLQQHPDYDLLEFPYEKGAQHFDFGRREYRDADAYWLQGELYRHAFACNKIFRRNLLEHVRFPKGRVFEDIYTLPDVTRKAALMATTTDGLYHYTVNTGGITRKANGQQVQQLLEGQLKAYRALSVRNDTPQRQAFYLQMLDTQLETSSKGGDIILPPYEGRLTIRSRYTWRCQLKIVLYRTLGIKLSCNLYNLLDRLLLHRS